MFALFEKFLRPTDVPPDRPPPVLVGRRGLLRFYLHFIVQVRGLLVLLFVAGLLVALLDVTIPAMIGRVVTLASTAAPAAIFAEHGRELLLMAAVMLILRPAALFLRSLTTNQAINAGMTNMIRWQSHWQRRKGRQEGKVFFF